MGESGRRGGANATHSVIYFSQVQCNDNNSLSVAVLAQVNLVWERALGPKRNIIINILVL